MQIEDLYGQHLHTAKPRCEAIAIISFISKQFKEEPAALICWPVFFMPRYYVVLKDFGISHRSDKNLQRQEQ